MNLSNVTLCLRSIAAGIWMAALLIATTAFSQTTAPAGHLLWQIGLADDLYHEFGDYQNGPETVTIPEEGAVLGSAECAKISRGVRASRNPVFEIKYQSAHVPEHGAMFSFKLLGAPKSGAQMAVFANGTMAGLIQLWGTEGADYPYLWRKIYRLYIPKEFLKEGENVIRLTAPVPFWSNQTAAASMWWQWDYLKLEALDAAVSEPWHGKISYLGTTLKLNDRGFDVDDRVLGYAPIALKWLGIAYSGNTIRADYWYDVARLQPRRLEYLKLLADYNMTVLVDNVGMGHFKNDASGDVPTKVKEGLAQFLKQYGSYIQYYELGNEPCMFGGGYLETLRLAEYLRQIKPDHMKLAAPGWAYGGGKGTPINWDAQVEKRREVEKRCDVLNGHSYGYSYADNRGGSFIENLCSVGEVEDGWPTECVTSETGANDWHSEENGPRLASTHPHAQAFDRIMRAHLAVVDRTMQHAAIFADFGIFSEPPSWDDPTQLKPYPGKDGDGKENRLKTFRRLALAYATHGTPLPYRVVDAEDGALAYFRAVDTSTLPAQPGSGAKSNKILLNFVNFENAPRTLKIQVTLPATGTYQAERIGAGETFAQSSSAVEFHTKPELELEEKLGPGESVQYILTPPAK